RSEPGVPPPRIRVALEEGDGSVGTALASTQPPPRDATPPPPASRVQCLNELSHCRLETISVQLCVSAMSLYSDIRLLVFLHSSSFFLFRFLFLLLILFS
ncbi:MAG: hypothetical protein PHU85_18770, partial [Phycisphaerae bacterium]|nr:hypothetical protein [Phycisphaerae bacterium]